MYSANGQRRKNASFL